MAGAPGPKGQRGQTGQKGEQGAAGIAGAQGAPGPTVSTKLLVCQEGLKYVPFNMEAVVMIDLNWKIHFNQCKEVDQG